MKSDSTLTTEDYQRIINTVEANESAGIAQDYDTQVKEAALDLMTKGDKATAFQKGLFEEQLFQAGYGNSNRDNFTQATGNNMTQIEQIAADIPNKTIASAFVADYKEGMPIDTYKRAFDVFYNNGYTDISFEKSMEIGSNFEAFIDRSTLYSIWALGQNQAREVSKVYVSQEQKDLVLMTAKALGVEVEFRDLVGTNGMYENGKIIISNQSINPAMVVFAHEFTHYLKQASQTEYQQYEDYVVNAFKEYQTEDYNKLYKRLAKSYGNDDVLIREEVAAHASETFLTDADFVNKFVQENQTIAQRIVSFLDSFITKLRNLYKDYKAKGKAGQMLEKDIETYTKARELWVEAVKNRKETYTKESNARYYLKPYSEHQIQNWANAKNIIVYESEEQFRYFIENPNEFGSKKMYLGVVGDYTAEKVKKELDIDIAGYNCVLGAYEIKKINKDHGTVATEAPRGQRPVITNDYLDIPYIMGKPDYVAKDFYNNQPAIKFQRDGATIFAVTSGKHLNLYVQTMYVHKDSPINKKSLATAIDEQASINTSETTSGTAFDNIISDNSQNDNTKNSFKGVNAAENDLSVLERAESMELANEPEWKIFSETGWFRGADGKWRFEIDDSKATVYRYGDAKMRNNEKYRKFKRMCVEGDFFNPEFAVLEETYGDIGECNHLTDYLVHDELYKNYPFLRRITIKKKNSDSGYGSFNMQTGEICVNKDLFSEYMEYVLKRTLLHEIQHAIQKQEGFANGANADTWSEVSIKNGSKELTNQEKYLMTAGEIEARDVSDRMNLTEEERRSKFPTRETEHGVIFAENRNNPFEPKFSMKLVDDSSMYSYDNLVKQDDMTVYSIAKSGLKHPTEQDSREDIIAKTRDNIAKFNEGKNDYGDRGLYNKSLGSCIVIGKEAIRHGLNRRNKINDTVKATVNLPLILENAIVVNETVGARKNADKGYVLLGAYEDNGLHCVQLLVNAYNNSEDSELVDMKVLYSVSAKNEAAALQGAPRHRVYCFICLKCSRFS